MKHVLFSIIIVASITASCGGRATPSGKEKDAGAGKSGVAEASAARGEQMKYYAYNVIKTYPHATDAYTQGLFWHDGYLYEGTGQRGQSKLLRKDLATGKVLKEIALDDRYFGEGIAWHGGRIYQLTWEAGKAFVYDGETFELLRTHSYKGEGWGIASDGEKLYMSDGTNRIFVRDPETFAIERTISVTANGNRQPLLNELEWIDGEIWANIYTYRQKYIVRIDPADGRITGVIDFDGIQAAEDFVPNETDVFNGIAYDRETGRIFVTGKNWNKVYEVEITEKK